MRVVAVVMRLRDCAISPHLTFAPGADASALS